MAQDPTVPKKPDFRELGISGTRLFSGLVSEETVPQLQGANAYKTYTGMRNDATGAAILKSIELPVRSSRWFVNPASDDPKNIELADFCYDTLWDFGDQSFDDVIRLALGCLAYGFSWLEILYSVIDQGTWTGKIGWDRLAYRSPGTKWRWNMDYVNGQRKLVSVTQLAAPFYQQVDIPKSKLLIFVNDQEGDNFDGASVLRPAWKDYFFRDSLYRLRAIGLERTYMGIPVATLPLEFGDDLAALAKQIVETIRTDEQAGVVKPESLTLEVLNNKLQGAEMDSAILFHNRQMLLASLAQFLDLGSGQAGAYNLSSDHSELFLMALLSKANYAASVLNQEPGLTTLLKFNFPNIQYTDLPKLEHGDIGQRSMDHLWRAVQAMGQTGFLTPDDETENRFRQMLDLPEREDTIGDRALVDLIQEVFPNDPERGRQYPPRPPAPALPGQPTAPAAQPASPPGQKEQASPEQMAERRAQLSELMARRRWQRPSRRMSPDERLAVKATEKFAEALEDFSHRLGQKPMRPSEVVARNRRPFVVQQFAEHSSKSAVAASARGRAIQARQQAAVRQHQRTLANILRPRATGETAG